jgi:alanine-glyoxylate transaminase / serine-glyoxylate transaminase / serine-pyruvate transaminase
MKMLCRFRASLDTSREEGLDSVFRSRDRKAKATCGAVRAWGLEILCLKPDEYLNSPTATLMPDGRNEAEFSTDGRNEAGFSKVVPNNFILSLGIGLGKVART